MALERLPDTKLGEWIKSTAQFVGILLVIIAAKTAIAEPFYVPSGSMEPTLLIGDELLATKFSYGYSSASLPFPFALPQSGRWLGALPERGDVVVFRWPGDRAQTWVKRVIGLPGDRIAIRDGQVWINGTPAALRPDGTGRVSDEGGWSIPATRYIETLPNTREHPIYKLFTVSARDNMPEIVVPPDRLFVMGDNRDNSADSRVAVRDGGVGLLPVENLVGRTDAVVGSWDTTVRQEPLWKWPLGLRLTRFFSAVH